MNTTNPLKKYLLPSYGELTVFLMAIVFIGLLVSDNALRSEIFDIPTSGSFDFQAFTYLMAFLFLFVGGLLLSLYHVFSSRPKNMIEKSMILIFAGVTNAIAGIAAGIHILDSSQDAWLVFPIWNIVSSFILIYILALSDENRLKDSDVTIP